jgi:hypothetical protein
VKLSVAVQINAATVFGAMAARSSDWCARRLGPGNHKGWDVDFEFFCRCLTLARPPGFTK